MCDPAPVAGGAARHHLVRGNPAAPAEPAVSTAPAAPLLFALYGGAIHVSEAHEPPGHGVDMRDGSSYIVTQ